MKRSIVVGLYFVLSACLQLACGKIERNLGAEGGADGTSAGAGGQAASSGHGGALASGGSGSEAGKGGGAPAGGHAGAVGAGGGDSGAAGADSGDAGAANGGATAGTGGAGGTAAGAGGTAAGAGGTAAGAGGTAAGAGGTAAGAGGSGPSCGNGVVEAGETCDKGVANGLELLRCAPDCSGIIQAKHIKFGPERVGGNLQPNPVATADASCPVGYKALFAYAAVRRATTSPNKVANSVDWVIHPYTYYVTATENPIWLTDGIALLGVRNGIFMGLVNRIVEGTNTVFTGLNGDWTTLGTDNCNGWTSSLAGYSEHYGFVYSKDIDFLYSSNVVSCESTEGFYCVEQ